MYFVCIVRNKNGISRVERRDVSPKLRIVNGWAYRETRKDETRIMAFKWQHGRRDGGRAGNINCSFGFESFAKWRKRAGAIVGRVKNCSDLKKTMATFALEMRLHVIMCENCSRIEFS